LAVLDLYLLDSNWVLLADGPPPFRHDAFSLLQHIVGDIRSAAFPKLRTRARKNCEHAVVPCSQLFLLRAPTGVWCDSWGRLHRRQPQS